MHLPNRLCLHTHKTRTVELPSDSTFAIAMKTQQQAEREEQQRIKNLVLNYDLQQSDDQEGKCIHVLRPAFISTWTHLN